uniref:Ribosomal protein S12 n=1 Tax=Marsupiomonas sp. NIES 1824 TaxID=1562198 RepID=A0A6H0QZQ8_9CHLO|nr:ribosomal protein S12 [Marsupiomonas sp. NIES 1824]
MSVTKMQLLRGRRKTKAKPRGKRIRRPYGGWGILPFPTALLRGRGFRKRICRRIQTLSPKKPNSALRKVARVQFSDRTRAIVKIPGEGAHQLAKYSLVLVRGGRRKDLPGVKYQVVRGGYACSPVNGRKSQRSKYGVRRPER